MARYYRRRHRLRTIIIIGALVVGAAWYFHALDTSGGCPPGAVYQNTSLEQYCATPTGDHVICVVSAFDMTPFRKDANVAVQYAKRGPDGPWCSDAQNQPLGE